MRYTFYMQLSQYAKQQGTRYRTALCWSHAGAVNGYQAPSGTIIVVEEQPPPLNQPRVVIHARVSSTEHRENRERQAERLTQYSAMKSYQAVQIVKEIASSVNDSRQKLLSLLKDRSITLLVVEHKDRLIRCDFRYLDTLLELQGRGIKVVNLAENDQADLVQDLASGVSSFCARLYRQQRAKRKTERIVKELADGEGNDALG